jgi:chromosome segregation ATPase
MGWFEIGSLILNLALGGSLIVTLVTLRATKVQAEANAKKAQAEAKTTELENVESAIKIWRDMANDLSEKYETVLDELEKLRREVSRLNRINTKIVKLLDKITPENMDAVIEQIKNEIQHETKDEIVSRLRGVAAGLQNATPSGSDPDAC